MVLMKPARIFLSLFCSIPLFLFNTCEEVTDPADECEKTKWANPVDRTLDIVTTIYSSQKIQNTPFRIDTANHFEVTGSIQKYYCDGTPSGKFDFTTTFYPTAGSDLYELRVGQAYQFKFENDDDHLRFNLKWKLFFNSGIVYESQTFVTDFYYEDINYNQYWLGYIAAYECVGFTWSTAP